MTPDECLPLLQHGPNRPEDVLKVNADEDDVGGDDAADCFRYLVATKARVVSQKKLRGSVKSASEDLSVEILRQIGANARRRYSLKPGAEFGIKPCAGFSYLYAGAVSN